MLVITTSIFIAIVRSTPHFFTYLTIISSTNKNPVYLLRWAL